METIILFTDTHFGVKNNSITWLNSQLDFIYNQFIPEIKDIKRSTNDKITLVHLGDVFDSRSTISTMVASRVKEAFKKLRSCVDQFNIIAGNHDYYSPNSNEIDTLNLLLKDTGANLITKDILEEGENAFIPWYEWGKPINDTIKRVFAHTDIINGPIEYLGKEIYSGHMHIPLLRKKMKLYNIGSCYALNFADSNQDRGYYIIQGDSLKYVANKQSIKFWRLYNDDIFNTKLTDNISSKDYIEIYIKQSKMAESLYGERLNIITKI